jgi:hypothetical protein
MCVDHHHHRRHHHIIMIAGTLLEVMDLKLDLHDGIYSLLLHQLAYILQPSIGPNNDYFSYISTSMAWNRSSQSRRSCHAATMWRRVAKYNDDRQSTCSFDVLEVGSD